MSGIPFHPLIVHFPIVLSVILPVAAILALLADRFRKERKYWAAVVLIHALLLGSGYLALQAGERDEERVEKVLASEAPLETHSDKAEFFVGATGLSLLVTALGLVSGPIGMSGRVLGSLASLLLLFLGFQVGHTGGELIYKHGAAAAFATDNGFGNKTGAPEGTGGGTGDED
jgi:uncharacterized membrane protein